MAVTTSVSQPPSVNFSATVITRMTAHSKNPTTKVAMRRAQVPKDVWRRSANVLRAMPNSDSEKVRNTLMLYMTTSLPTSPAV